MSTQVVVEIIKILPSIIWIVFGATALGLFYLPIRENLLPRLQTFKAWGIETSFIKEVLDKAAENNLTGDEQSRTALTRRAERLAQIAAGAKILLVNDEPSDMSYVMDILEKMKIAVTIATDTKTALNLLKENQFDVVISDMRRGGSQNEGIAFLSEAIKLGINRPTIFTVGDYDPSRGTPAYAFGITNRVDDLLNYVFDVLERTRG